MGDMAALLRIPAPLVSTHRAGLYNSFRCLWILNLATTSLVAQTVKASAYNAGDPGLIPGSGRCPGEGNGNSLQYSCLGNPMDRGASWITVYRVAKKWDTT